MSPYQVVLHLEASAKWPDHDLNALRAVKAQFILEVTRKIKNDLKIPCLARSSCIDLVFEGHVFRIRFAITKEVTTLREVMTGTGLVMKKLDEVPEAEELHFNHEILPKLCSAINSLNTSYKAFSSVCRLIKRWISSQMCEHYIDDIVIDLLVCRMFLPTCFGENEANVSPPGSAINGLLRFLSFLSRDPFSLKETPANHVIFINFDGAFSSEEGMIKARKSIDNFVKNKKHDLPGILLVTPFDQMPSMVTTLSFMSEKNRFGIVDFLVKSATKSKQLLECHLSCPQMFAISLAFSLPLDKFHAVIRVQPKSPVKKGVKNGLNTTQIMPLIEFNPIEKYLKLLRSMYGSLGMFLHDIHGKNGIIALMFKPKVFHSQPITSLDNLALNEVNISQDQKSVITRIDALFESFKELGRGIVVSVEPQTSNWPLD